jgi:hypothetical protein
LRCGPCRSGSSVEPIESPSFGQPFPDCRSLPKRTKEDEKPVHQAGSWSPSPGASEPAPKTGRRVAVEPSPSRSVSGSESGSKDAGAPSGCQSRYRFRYRPRFRWGGDTRPPPPGQGPAAPRSRLPFLRLNPFGKSLPPCAPREPFPSQPPHVTFPAGVPSGRGSHRRTGDRWLRSCLAHHRLMAFTPPAYRTGPPACPDCVVTAVSPFFGQFPSPTAGVCRKERKKTKEQDTQPVCPAAFHVPFFGSFRFFRQPSPTPAGVRRKERKKTKKQDAGPGRPASIRVPLFSALFVSFGSSLPRPQEFAEKNEKRRKSRTPSQSVPPRSMSPFSALFVSFGNPLRRPQEFAEKNERRRKSRTPGRTVPPRSGSPFFGSFRFFRLNPFGKSLPPCAPREPLPSQPPHVTFPAGVPSGRKSHGGPATGGCARASRTTG